MPKKTSRKAKLKNIQFVRKVGQIEEYRCLSNDLCILYQNIPDTGIVTTNITYRVGARDESMGETGLAHMLEHMLFKPTKHDKKRGIDSGAMDFERKTGCVLNANTWKDRTTYYFSYPKEHFTKALKIESERMQDTLIEDAELQPERENVLSEHDMVDGRPDHAIATVMVGSAFHSHPYGHETIGFRNDIEDYTVEKLERFYKLFYRPDNATLMILGDIDCEEALTTAEKLFGGKENPSQEIPREYAREPRQEGLRRVSVVRPSTIQLLSIGFKHSGFPSHDWLTAQVLLDVLTDEREGILQKLLIDTGVASSVEGMLEPTSEMNLGYLNITTTLEANLDDIESKVLQKLRSLNTNEIKKLTKNVIAKSLTNELYARESSLSIAAELTEYVAAGDWTQFYQVEKELKKITSEKLVAMAKELFEEKNLTIGTYTNV